MAQSDVTTTVDINGEKITVYVDDQEFYDEVKMELVKRHQSLVGFLKTEFAKYVNDSGVDIKTHAEDPELKRKVKAINSLNGYTMKDAIQNVMENLVN